MRQRPVRSRILLIAVVALCSIATGITLETWRRHNLYWYDVSQDYAYEFGPDASRSYHVDVESDGFVLPAWEGRQHTALLKLRLSSGLLGWWFDPCVTITTSYGLDRQCFDRGGEGSRYVLLPPAVVEPGHRILMRGEHLHWEPQTAEVILFDTPDISDSRVLILAPHPDDAEIAAFGLYATHKAFIVTMTAGNYVDGLYSRLNEDTSGQDSLRGRVRTWDAFAVPLWGGVKPEKVLSLGYLTYSLKAYHDAARSGSPVPEAVLRVPTDYRQGALEDLLGNRHATPEWDSVVADLVAALERIRPDVVVSPHPLLDDHTDHQYTTYALLEALHRISDDRTLLLLYNNHHVLTEHYPFGSSDARITLPPWFGNGPFTGLFSYDLDADLQQQKLFALEAMHDLRPAPLRLTGGPANVLLARLRQAYEVVRRDPFGDYSYFRRAVRPNELFFVYGPGDRSRITTGPATPKRLPLTYEGLR